MANPAPNIKALLAQCRGIATESLSDDDVPAAIEQLAAIAAVDTGVKIHAIKRGESTQTVPSRPVADDILWHARRLSCQPLPTDPEPVTVRRPCWSLIVDGRPGGGSPVALEQWFLDQGIEALAVNPTCCQVVIE